MSHSHTSSRLHGDHSLPKGFTTIKHLLEDHHSIGKTVSVIGVVKDYMLPIQTQGSEHGQGINFNIFRPKEAMPTFQAGDLVVASMVKVQQWQHTPSLLSQHISDIHVFDGQRLSDSRNSRSTRAALRPPPKKTRREPDPTEHDYVFWLHSTIDRSSIPDREELDVQVEQSTTIKNKFSLLTDAQEGKFIDIIARVVRSPYDLGDKINMWVSDYTQNPQFFNQTAAGQDWIDGRPICDANPYGYAANANQSISSEPAQQKWLGPYGKMSMQLTCWEPHANFIRNQVRPGDWIHLRNLQIGYGRNGTNLEGFLREDQKYPDRIYLSVLNHLANAETMDTRLKDAIRRKRGCEQDRGPAVKSGAKRKLNESVKKGQPGYPRSRRKTSRQKERDDKAKAIEARESSEKAALLDLNDLVRCEHQDKGPTPLSSILESVRYNTNFQLPFICAKYLTHARVIDFHPAKLENFAVSRRPSEYECLSDNSGDDGDGDDSSSSVNGDRPRHGQAAVIWEWRFALKLEDPFSRARGDGKTKTPAAATTVAWAVVDNHAAELLTNLSAANLRVDHELLGKLREHMFRLWGDLEERKNAAVARSRKMRGRAWQQPPPIDSDAEEAEAAPPTAAGAVANGVCSGSGTPGLHQASNKPFTCCIQQYGVKVRAEEDEDEDAGEGKRWQRVFGLFGTQIARN